jgi:hypothetical protein
MNNLDLLKSKIRREPFRTFIIEFQSGATLVVDKDTEILFPRKRPELAITFSDGGLQHEFEASAINRLIEAT